LVIENTFLGSRTSALTRYINRFDMIYSALSKKVER
jgi:hypothetical protein